MKHMFEVLLKTGGTMLFIFLTTSKYVQNLHGSATRRHSTSVNIDPQPSHRSTRTPYVCWMRMLMNRCPRSALPGLWSVHPTASYMPGCTRTTHSRGKWLLTAPVPESCARKNLSSFRGVSAQGREVGKGLESSTSWDR